MTRFVLITRHPDDCRELQQLLAPHDIVVKPFPVLRLEDVDDRKGWRAVLQRLPEGHVRAAWLLLASPRAPDRFATQARDRAAYLLELPVAAVGEATAAAAEDAGFEVQVVGPGNGAGLAETLLPFLEPACQIVFACGHDRRRELPEALSAAGHRVLPVVVYRMRQTPVRELPPLGPRLDVVVLTSPRSASYYLEGVGGLPLPCQHMALGQTTQTAAQGLGISCRIPAQPTMQSLAETLVEELCRT